MKKYKYGSERVKCSTLGLLKVFKTNSCGFPFGAQDYGNSTMAAPPVSG